MSLVLAASSVRNASLKIVPGYDDPVAKSGAAVQLSVKLVKRST